MSHPHQVPHHDPQWPLPTDWVGPTFVGDTWATRGLSVWTRESGEWPWSGVPEDYAHEPIVEWSDADRAIVTAAVASDLEDGCTAEVSWPPTPSLWTPGIAIRTKNGDLDVTLAEWHWHVHVILLEVIDGGRGFVEVGNTREHILTTKVDPRSVEYDHTPFR